MNGLNIVVMGAAGRMGSLIAGLAAETDGMELAGVVDRAEMQGKLSGYGCPAADSLGKILKNGPHCVVIDFTVPAVAINTAHICAETRTPVVIGTTGLDEKQKGELALLAQKTPVLWSANMSVGVNVLMRILPRLAQALGPAYDMELVEIHHRNKKDAPSGTALMLAEALANARNWRLADARVSCRDGVIGARKDKEIGVMALRGGDVAGIHSIYFMGPGETVEIRHQAESRENFAMGALRAARWLAGRESGRLYSMQDVIA